MLMLRNTFIELLKNYTKDDSLIDHLWTEIVEQYAAHNRYYHTLQHLDNLLLLLIDLKEKIKNWDVILFTLYYHDIIYDPLQSDNEEKSADLAEKRMKQIGVSNHIIKLCRKQILATKSHLESTDSDTNYFTDADLSILGQACEMYALYFQNVRKEYAIYSNAMYRVGRLKVLKKILSMHRIFKTAYFYQKFEQQAQENLKKEVVQLEG